MTKVLPWTTAHATLTALVVQIQRLATMTKQPQRMTVLALKMTTAVFVAATTPHAVVAQIQKHATTTSPRFWTMGRASSQTQLSDATAVLKEDLWPF